MMDETIRAGGCQCGAVRFRIRGKLGRASICHCRMCQKAFGGFFGPLVSVPVDGLEWTRGEPKYFQSSINIDRGFCENCGTPLSYRYPGNIELSIGSFDIRDDLSPAVQVNHASRIAWIETIFDQPILQDERGIDKQEQIISFQHPDHDTASWPRKGLHL